MSTEFSVDFTTLIPQGFLPSFKQATSAYNQTIPNCPKNIRFRQNSKKRGEFFITVFSEEDAKRLQGQKIRFDYGPRGKYNAQVKLVRQAAYVFRTNPKQVYIDQIFDSGLQFAANEEFDTWLEQYVTVIRKTSDDRDNDSGFLNGRKTAYVDFNKNKEIPRFTEMELNVVTSNCDVETARGEIKVTYRNQPVFCRLCKADHIGRCPIREKEEVDKREEDRLRQPKIKTLLVGDSNLRHVNEQATTATTRVATGAKIGHAANVLKFEEPSVYPNVIIHAGGNNIQQGVRSFSAWENQLRYESDQLHQQLQRFPGQKTIIGVPTSEQATASTETHKMRESINEELKKLAQTVNANFLLVDDEIGEDEEAWVDYRHYSEVMCAKVLESIDASLHDDQKLLLRGKRSTTPRKYGKVNSSYKLGCTACTKMGHLEEGCSKSFKRTDRPSGGHSPPSKAAAQY